MPFTLNPFTGNFDFKGLNYVSKSAAPTTSDTGYAVPTLWVDTANNALYLLAANDGTTATWTELGAGGGGGLIPLDEQTASASSSIDMTTGIDSTYGVYLVTMENVRPTTEANPFWMRTSTDGGSSFDSGASDYGYSRTQNESIAGFISSTDNSDSKLPLVASTDPGNVGGESLSGNVWIYNPSNASYNTNVASSLVVNTRFGSFGHYTIHGCRKSTGDVDAVQFLFNGTTVATGTFRLYGISNS